MKNNIKYSKNVLWLKPFVEKAKDLIAYKKIVKIRGYQVKAKLDEQTDASIIIDDSKNGQMSINLLIKSYSKTKKEHRSKPMHYILDSFAHELAHTIEWEHTPEHYRLQARIMLRFAQVIDKLRIKDTSLCFKEK